MAFWRDESRRLSLRRNPSGFHPCPLTNEYHAFSPCVQQTSACYDLRFVLGWVVSPTQVASATRCLATRQQVAHIRVTVCPGNRKLHAHASPNWRALFHFSNEVRTRTLFAPMLTGKPRLSWRNQKGQNVNSFARGLAHPAPLSEHFASFFSFFAPLR